MGIYDVPAGILIKEVATDLKEKLTKPAFAEHAKTGAHRERQPNDPDWFYTRAASILYRVYKEGGTGTGTLRTYYGGRKKRGVKPEEKRKASGKVIRTCLQMLEKEGLLKKEKKGRKVSAKGEKYLFEKAKAVQATFEDMLKAKERKAAEENLKRAEMKAKVEQQRHSTQVPETRKQGSAQKPARQPTNAQHSDNGKKQEQETKKDEKTNFAPAG